MDARIDRTIVWLGSNKSVRNIKFAWPGSQEVYGEALVDCSPVRSIAIKTGRVRWHVY